MTIKDTLTEVEKVEVADSDLAIQKLKAMQLALEASFKVVADNHFAEHRALSVQIETLQAEKLAVQTVEIAPKEEEIVKP